jgi:uncharacterized membrane protein
MVGWLEFAVAMVLFLASHRLPAVAGLKERATGLLGQRGYAVVFSIVSLGLLWWLVIAAGRAPFVPLWDQHPWHRWTVNIAMPCALALGTFGVGASNPFAFEGRAAGFDPQHPGIAGVTRQPLLWALAIWAGAHLLPNGDLAHVLLFAPMLLLALAGMPLVEGRRRRAMGREEWVRLSARTGLLPGAALAAGRWHPRAGPPLMRLVLWAILWVGVWQLHAAVIGVWPGV